jgi:N-acetylglutamate synthase-like GNAT family acetyltransferase
MLGEWVLRTARPADLATVRALVEQCGLANDAIEDQFGDAYAVAEVGDELVGVAGIEVHGTCGLLRSLAVAPHARGQGLGAALVRDRVEWANNKRLESVHLLTTTASDFFARHGFVAIARDEAPSEIKLSKEFSEMCPASATFMELTRGGA